MGGDRPYTTAELQQIERDQQDPRWLAWLADMDAQIDRFFTETVPGTYDDPWSAEALRRVEKAALDFFPTSETVDLPQNRAIADQFHRYIGEVFRRNLDGSWLNVPDYDDEQRTRGFGPVVTLPFNEMYFTVVSQLTAAMYRRTGTAWSEILGYQTQDYSAWIQAGRPPLTEWIEMRED